MTDEEFKKAVLACQTSDEVWRLAERQASERAGKPGGPVLAWVHEADAILREAAGEGHLEDEIEIDYNRLGE